MKVIAAIDGDEKTGIEKTARVLRCQLATGNLPVPQGRTGIGFAIDPHACHSPLALRFVPFLFSQCGK